MRHNATLRQLATVGFVLGLAACGANQSAAGDPADSVPSESTLAESTSAEVTTTQPVEITETTIADTVPATTEMAMDDHMDDDTTATTMDMSHDEMEAAEAWPRPWDPAQPIDFSGVPGVTPEQQAFAEKLAADTIRDLPQFADPATLGALGYSSIGDAPTGYEHYINGAYLVDDHVLDPNYPESVVYEVNGDERTLSAAMFMVADTAVDDPELEGIGGPLMQWHVHTDLCWELTADGPKVVGTHGPGQSCPDGQISSNLVGERVPMVHVWVLPNQCGPFAALEGIGAGQVDTDAEVRMDQCHEDH